MPTAMPTLVSFTTALLLRYPFRRKKSIVDQSAGDDPTSPLDVTIDNAHCQVTLI